MSERLPLAIVTGASSGIGAATAQALAAKGYPLLLLARRLDLLERLKLDDALCLAVDVTDPGAVAAAVTRATETYGEPDLLVNNAGIMPLGRVVDQDPIEWHRLFEVNCLALLHVTQAVLPGMVERRHGTVVNVSSIAGRNVYANHTVYSGTKFAVHAMTESMRKEHAADNIRFTVIAPGMVETDLLSSVSDPEIKRNYEAGKARIGGALSPDIVGQSIVGVYELPQQVCVRELVVAPTAQES
jgi:NADP-dependent 3-hydroxy acid dehydrogenase YdfG